MNHDASLSSTVARPRRLGSSLALGALVVLNLVLGLSLVSGLLPDNTADANSAAAQVGRPSEYLMVPSRPVGLNQDIVYIVDTENGWLSVIGYNQTNRVIEFSSRVPLN